jgi:hypothetical protein
MRNDADELSMDILNEPAPIDYVATFEYVGTKELRSVYSIQH